MKKVIFLIATLLSFAGMSAQNNDDENIERYKQLLKLNHQSYETCSNKVNSWGFTLNKGGIINMFTLQMNPFVSNNSNDSTGFVLSVMEDKVVGMSLTVGGYDPVGMFARVQKFSDAQNAICEEEGLTDYVCAVKGSFKAKMPGTHAELIALLKELDPNEVKQIVEMWKTPDKKVAASCVYENKRFGKKKPRPDQGIELTISLTDNRE
jgi:hypothetical protein